MARGGRGKRNSTDGGIEWVGSNSLVTNQPRCIVIIWLNCSNKNKRTRIENAEMELVCRRYLNQHSRNFFEVFPLSM